MWLDLLNQDVDNRLSWASRVGQLYGVKVNALSVDKLFGLYQRAGFLDPAKATRLLPHIDLVRDNWQRLLQAGDSLLYTWKSRWPAKTFSTISIRNLVRILLTPGRRR